MKELTITKFIFDNWWTSTYVDRLTPLLPQEIEMLVDYHWKELRSKIRHSMRETDQESCTCNSAIARIQGLHLKDCPVYQEAP